MAVPGDSTTTHLLEINLISAQNLKPPSSTLGRRLATYAVAFIHPSTKLRTRIDRIGSQNPTWNDKFIFRVSSDFLRSETSGVTVQIYATGLIRDTLIGSVRILISSFEGIRVGIGEEVQSSSSLAAILMPSFGAFQIRRPSGTFEGVLNVGAMVREGMGSEMMRFGDAKAIGWRDLMGTRSNRHSRNVSSSSDYDSERESGASTPGSSMVLRELNGRDLGRKGKG
ncbi:hypothetical protein Droror1_Dr00000583 [Drosera rotundifolia]